MGDCISAQVTPGSPLLQLWDAQVATNMSIMPPLPGDTPSLQYNPANQSICRCRKRCEIINRSIQPALFRISCYWNIISPPNKSHKSHCLLKYFWELCGKTIKRTKLWKHNLNIKSIIVEYWIWDNSGMIFCQQSKFNLKFVTSAKSVFSQNVDGGSNRSWK